MQRLRKRTGGALLLLAGVLMLIGYAAQGRGDPAVAVDRDEQPDRREAPADRGSHDEPPRQPIPLRLLVDPSLAPSVAMVDGLDDDDAPRPVGRVAAADGPPMDIVLDEIMITYEDEAALERFVAAVDGEVVDRFDDEDEPVRDALVRFAPYEVSDPAAVAAAMVALEDDLDGDWTVSDPAVLAVLDMLGRAVEAGVVAMPNALHDPAGFAEGSTTDGRARSTYGTDATEYGSDAFTWPYVASGTAQDVGLDVAWRLLADVGAFGPRSPGWAHRVRIMVVDRGFRINDDVPAYRKIRRTDWGDENRDGSPWHGALVVNSLMGKVDNGFGGAGPAGPLEPGLIAVHTPGASWDGVRTLVKLVDEHRPHIINMSYGSSITTARLANQDFYDRKFSTIKHDYGALPIASAGNDGRDIDDKRRGAVVERVLTMPCEAKHVVCVGGMGEDTTVRAKAGCGDTVGSNYGTSTGGRSVEIWGPYYVVAHSGTGTGAGRACGTSFASPFVAGVAALVKAADPSLDPDGIWNILKDTAHHGGIGSEVRGHQRRINARDAVLRAHGKPIDRPQVQITSPRHDDAFTVGTWVDLTAQTRDHLGRTNLPVTWMSNKDGVIAGPSTTGTFTESLSPGLHSIVATVTDRLGQTAHDQVLVRVTARPIVVSILAPTDGGEIVATNDLVLVGNAIDESRPLDTISGSLLRWTITRAAAPDTTLFETVGRTPTIPAGALEPGSYRVRLTVTIDAQTIAEEVRFSVAEPDPGAPKVTMLAPSPGSSYSTSTSGVTLRLRGVATDAGGNTLSGSQLRWVARRGSQVQVLCAGTHTPGAAGGGLAALTLCDDVEVELDDVPLGPSSWVISLEAYSSAGSAGTERGVTVTFTPPPVG